MGGGERLGGALLGGLDFFLGGGCGTTLALDCLELTVESSSPRLRLLPEVDGFDDILASESLFLKSLEALIRRRTAPMLVSIVARKSGMQPPQSADFPSAW